LAAPNEPVICQSLLGSKVSPALGENRSALSVDCPSALVPVIAPVVALVVVARLKPSKARQLSQRPPREFECGL